MLMYSIRKRKDMQVMDLNLLCKSAIVTRKDFVEDIVICQVMKKSALIVKN